MTIRTWLYQNLIPEGASSLSKANWCVLGIILCSIVVAVIESEPIFKNSFPEIFWGTNLIFAVIFTVEYVFRLWAIGENPKERGVGAWFRYSCRDLNWVDIIVTLVLWVGLFFTFSGSVAVVLRFFRAFRLVRFIRQSAWAIAIRALWTAVQKRRIELYLSFIIAMAIIVIAATCLFVVEGSTQPKDFGSIPRAMWWAVVTLTTIGYGDATPITTLGKLIGGMIGVFSMALVALPTGILASAFSDAFQEVRHGASGRPGKTP